MLIAAKIRRPKDMFKILEDLAFPSSWSFDQRKKVSAHFKHIKHLEEERDKIAHATWWFVIGDPTVAHADLRNRATPDRSIQRTAKDLNDLAEEIHHAAGTLMFLIFLGP